MDTLTFLVSLLHNVANYHYKDFKLHITINEKFFTKEITNLYNLINLEALFRLKGLYSMKVYLFLKQTENNKELEFSINSLHKNFYTPISLRYKYFSFKQRILKTSVEEINEKSDLQIAYRENKNTNKVISITFLTIDNQLFSSL